VHRHLPSIPAIPSLISSVWTFEIWKICVGDLLAAAFVLLFGSGAVVDIASLVAAGHHLLPPDELDWLNSMHRLESVLYLCCHVANKLTLIDSILYSWIPWAVLPPSTKCHQNLFISLNNAADNRTDKQMWVETYPRASSNMSASDRMSRSEHSVAHSRVNPSTTMWRYHVIITKYQNVENGVNTGPTQSKLPTAH